MPILFSPGLRGVTRNGRLRDEKGSTAIGEGRIPWVELLSPHAGDAPWRCGLVDWIELYRGGVRQAAKRPDEQARW